MPTRRKPPSTSTSLNGSTTRMPPPQQTQSASPSSLFRPSTFEAALLTAYPVILLLGSASSVLSPTTRSVPYNPSTQSHTQDPALTPSYFARKSNALNVYFVKIGWAWTTFALFAATTAHPALAGGGRRARVWVRWGVATLLWIALTQWFFGAPLIDRGFRLTGGQCVLLEEKLAREGPDAAQGAKKVFEEVVSAASCKIAGGRWQGGHDISGHVFLLVLGSALLIKEMMPIFSWGSGAEEIGLAEKKREVRREEVSQVAQYGVRAALVVTGLMFWMLLMTATFFHTWTEKFAGLVVAFFGIWLVYFLPKGFPEVQAVLGVPGA